MTSTIEIVKRCEATKTLITFEELQRTSYEEIARAVLKKWVIDDYFSIYSVKSV